MFPAHLEAEAMAEHGRDLEERAARVRRARRGGASRRPTADHDEPGSVTLRWAAPADRPALRRLAALDEAPVPTGNVLVAELDGVPVAALGVERGEAVADPFVPTASIVRLLALRARQLRGGRPRRRVRPLGLRAALR
jgi:hypothetical protein